MKERIVLIPSAAGNEIARSLSLRGINTFALRIIDSFEFAQSALIRSGYVFGKKILTQREQTALIYSIIKKDRDGYFSKASYIDAENIASALNMLRFLCPENERENIKKALESGTFREKNDSIFSVYEKYLTACREKNLGDQISMIRAAIEKKCVIDAEILYLREFPLTPLEKKLLDCVSNGINEEKSIRFLYNCDEKLVHISEYKEAYGASNEVSDIIGTILKNKLPFDRCLVAISDIKEYSQLFYDITKRYNIPVTFGCGISILNTEPAKNLKNIHNWATKGCCGKDALKELVDSPSFDRSGIYELLSGFENRRKAMEALIEIMGSLRIGLDKKSNEENISAYEKMVSKDSEEAKILDVVKILAADFESGYSGIVRKYSCIRTGDESQLDKDAVKIITETFSAAKAFNEEVSADELIKVILTKNVGSEAAAEGCLHICGINGALSTVRENCFIAGMSADRFPGKARENYLLLDDDLSYFGKNAPDSESRIRNRKVLLDNVLLLLSSLEVKTVISYSSYALADLKNANASTALLEYFRNENGRDIGKEDYTKAGFFEHIYTSADTIGREYINGGMAAKAGTEKDVESIDENIKDYECDIEREWSPSAIEDCLKCGRLFYLKDVLHIQEPDTDDPYTVADAITFGLLLHEMLADIRPDTDKDKLLEESSKRFDRFLAERPPVSADNAEKRKNEFLEIIESALEDDPKNTPVIAEEELHAMHSSGLRLRGRPDRVEKLPNGKYVVVDYKTGKTVVHIENDAVSCLQALLYAYMLKQEMGYEIDHVEYRYPKVKETVSCLYNKSFENEIDGLLDRFKDGVKSGKMCKALKCLDYCGYKDVCK